MRLRQFARMFHQLGFYGGLALTLLGALHAQDYAADARKLENQGEAAQAQARLRAQAQQSPNDAAAQRAYAEFLDTHGNPAALEAYGKLAQALVRANAPRDQRATVSRRMTVLALSWGD